MATPHQTSRTSPSLLVARQRVLENERKFKHATILQSYAREQKVTFKLFDVRHAAYDLNTKNAKRTLAQDHVAWVCWPDLAAIPVLRANESHDPEIGMALWKAFDHIIMNPSHPFSHRGDPDNRVALPSASMYLEQYHLLLAEIYGTKSVCRRFFSPIYRNSATDAVPFEHGKPMAPAGALHSDYGLQQCLRMLRLQNLDPSQQHYKIVSVWVPLKAGGHPPLAAIPASTVDPAHIQEYGGNLGLSSESQEKLHEHALWYLSDQTPEEVTVLEFFDSKQSSAAGHHHVGVQHGSPEVKGFEHLKTRQSIEIRVIVEVHE